MKYADTIDLNRGRKEYEAKIKDIEGILSKVKDLLDTSKYYSQLEQIKNKVNNDPNLVVNMPTYNMMLDYESMSFKDYIKALDSLLYEIERDVTPYYELYLLFSKIDMQIAKVTWENINEIIENTLKLINSLNYLNTLGDIKKEILIRKAYKTIYSCILNEEMFNRSDILTYINHLNIAVHRENIGRLLENDLNELSSEDLIDSDLKTIKTKGIGNDYLDQEIVKKVSIKTVGETNSEYQERKRIATENISTDVTSFNTRKNNSMSKLSDIKNNINHLKRQRMILASKALTFLMIPVIAFSAGNTVGKSSSSKITEYQTITRTVDLNTGKTIGEPTIIYDENETTYVATVLVCSPWKKSTTGNGFIQNVTAYEYKVPENTDENYHITMDDLNDNLLKKYDYNNYKDTLENNDSLTESTILVTETYQNKNEHRPSTKYIVSFSIIGACLGLAIDVALVLLRVFGFEETKRRFEYLKEELESQKLNEEETKAKLLQMKDEALDLQKKYNDVIRDYGNLNEKTTLLNTKYFEDSIKQLDAKYFKESIRELNNNSKKKMILKRSK